MIRMISVTMLFLMLSPVLLYGQDSEVMNADSALTEAAKTNYIGIESIAVVKSFFYEKLINKKKGKGYVSAEAGFLNILGDKYFYSEVGLVGRPNKLQYEGSVGYGFSMDEEANKILVRPLGIRWNISSSFLARGSLLMAAGGGDVLTIPLLSVAIGF